MNARKPFVVTIAGFDPSAGAGILADIKTMEQSGVYGVGVLSSNTYQTDVLFEAVEWIPFTKIKKQLDLQCQRFKFPVAKIGLIKDAKTLIKTCELLKAYNPYIQIVWDPILSASAGFTFHENFNESDLLYLLDLCFIITPNKKEFEYLFPTDELKEIAKSVCHILVKGGHDAGDFSNDVLYSDEQLTVFEQERLDITEKHGTGCVFSSALASALAQRIPLDEACRMAKSYTLERIKSNNTKLAFHV